MKIKLIAICFALLLAFTAALDSVEEVNNPLAEIDEENKLMEEEVEHALRDLDEVEEFEETEEEPGVLPRGGPSCPVRCGRRCCPHNGYSCTRGSCRCRNQCGRNCCRRGFYCHTGRNQCVPADRCDWQQECGRYCCANEHYCTRSRGQFFCQPSPRRCRHNWYTTYTQNQWGAECRGRSSPACTLERNFDRCYRRGITLGCNRGGRVTWNDPEAIKDFLPSNDRPFDVLTDVLTNPTDNGTALWGNLLATGLNIGFDTCLDSFSRGCQHWRDLYICDHGQRYFNRFSCRDYYGLKISEFYQLANNALGGCCRERRCNLNRINQCLTAINNAFPGGRNLPSIFDDEFSQKRCPPRRS